MEHPPKSGPCGDAGRNRDQALMFLRLSPRRTFNGEQTRGNRQASLLLSWQMWRDDLMKTDLQLIEVHRREATCHCCDGACRTPNVLGCGDCSKLRQLRLRVGSMHARVKWVVHATCCHAHSSTTSLAVEALWVRTRSGVYCCRERL